MFLDEIKNNRTMALVACQEVILVTPGYERLVFVQVERHLERKIHDDCVRVDPHDPAVASTSASCLPFAHNAQGKIRGGHCMRWPGLAAYHSARSRVVSDSSCRRRPTFEYLHSTRLA